MECNMIRCNIQTKNLIQHIKTQIELFEIRKDIMYYTNCNIHVKNLRQHMRSQRHIKFINEIYKDNYSQLMKKKDYFGCNLCNVQVKNQNKIANLKNILRFKMIRSKSEEIQCIVHCNECNFYIKNHEQHVLSVKHKNIIKKMNSFKNTSMHIMDFKKQYIEHTKNMCTIELVNLTIKNSLKQ